MSCNFPFLLSKHSACLSDAIGHDFFVSRSSAALVKHLMIEETIFLQCISSSLAHEIHYDLLWPGLTDDGSILRVLVT